MAVLLTVVYVCHDDAGELRAAALPAARNPVPRRIAGLVLNLISGVSKLRICGAEQHAFRVWAQQFAEPAQDQLHGRSDPEPVGATVRGVLSDPVVDGALLRGDLGSGRRRRQASRR